MTVEAAERLFRVELDHQRLKTLPIRGLVNQILPFEDYLALMCQEARSEWWQLRHQKVRYSAA